MLQPVQRSFGNKYPAKDFHFWAMYGSWSCCQHCGSYHFNDACFKEGVYKDPGTSLAHVRQVPSHPVEHCQGSVGISSRWWYLPLTYKPVAHCRRCTPPPRKLEDVLVHRNKHPVLHPKVDSTGELYVIPCIVPPEQLLLLSQWRRTSPRYPEGNFENGKSPGPQYGGESMLELNDKERRALQIVVLLTKVKKEEYGASHQFNWKKLASAKLVSKRSS